MLNSGCGFLQKLPDHSILVDALLNALNCRSDDINVINWSNPAFVFPFLSRVLHSDSYFYSILSGWVVAMGGLTEAVVKESSRSLIDHCKFASKNENNTFVEKLATVILQLLYDFQDSDRVKIPTLKTLILLMKSDCVSKYYHDNFQWVDKLILFIKTEIPSTGDLKKLLVCIDVLVHVLDITEELDHKTLISKQMVVLTGHKYPRIRKYAAEQLYLQCLSSRLDNLFEIATATTGFEESLSNDENKSKKDLITNIIILSMFVGSHPAAFL